MILPITDSRCQAIAVFCRFQLGNENERNFKDKEFRKKSFKTVANYLGTTKVITVSEVSKAAEGKWSMLA